MQSKPVYRVAAAGLDPRDVRLIEIVFRHCEYNKYEFRLAAAPSPGEVDILIVNTSEPEGLKAMTSLRAANAMVPVIAAVPKGARATSEHAIAIDRLTLQLMPILNRVVEEVIEGGGHASVDATALAALAATPATGSAATGPGAFAPVTALADRPAATPSECGAPQPGERTEPTLATPAFPPAAPARRDLPLGGTVFDLPPAPPPTRPRPAPTPSAPAPQPSSRHTTTLMQTSPTPAEPPDAQQTGQNLVAFPRSPEARAGHRLRALVVDDSPTVRQQMLAALTRMGMVCELASSGPEAMARLAEGHFDITLVDVMMPDMDGYRLTREIKRNKHLSDMPVIILTSRSSPFDLARGALAGCDAYLKKPVPLRQLESALVKALRRSLAIDDIGSLLRLSSANPAPDTVPRRKSALSS